MKYVDDFEMILEMAEDEAEKMTIAMVYIMDIPFLEKTSDGGYIECRFTNSNAKIVEN